MLYEIYGNIASHLGSYPPLHDKDQKTAPPALRAQKGNYQFTLPKRQQSTLCRLLAASFYSNNVRK